MSGSVSEGVAALERAAGALVGLDVGGLSGEALGEVLARLEAVEGQLAAVRSRVVAAVEVEGSWAVGGARSLRGWVRQRTGRLDREAGRMVAQARALRDHLPRTAAALADGEIGPDHAAMIVRHATSSPGCVAMLADAELGEEFLVRQAQGLDAGRLTVLLRHWALRADPDAADRRWKEEGEREEFSLARTTDGYHGTIWLSEVNGQLVERALQAQAGRRAADDGRGPAQRRAAALVELAGSVLDRGELQRGARIRPHLAITASLDTLLKVAQAQRPSPDVPGTDPPGTVAAGSDGDSPAGLVSVISTNLDYGALQGVEPARLEDGSPVPFGLFAQLACESQLHRVVFGAQGEILDVGREERLFTAGQARGIIARDGHCQFPSCTAPPGQGEIHHSLWWYAHHGATATANGILLCRYHHGFVHKRALLIERYTDRWRFARPNGTTFGETLTGTPLQLSLT